MRVLHFFLIANQYDGLVLPPKQKFLVLPLVSHMNIHHNEVIPYSSSQKKKEKSYTLFFIGPNIPGGSCSLSVQVIPLSYDRFMHPLHLKFNKQTVSRSMQKMAVITIKFTFLQGAKKSRA